MCRVTHRPLRINMRSFFLGAGDPNQTRGAFCFHVTDFGNFHIQGRSRRLFSLCLFFSLSVMSFGFMPITAKEGSPFSWLNNIPSCVGTTSSLSIRPRVDTQVGSIPWPLWVTLQWTWWCRRLFEIPTSLPLGISEMGSLDRVGVWRWGTRGAVGKGTKFQLRRMNKSRHRMGSTITIINNTALNTANLLRG